MKLSRLFVKLFMVAAISAPFGVIVHKQAMAQGAIPRADWKATKAKKAVPKSAKNKALKGPLAQSDVLQPVDPAAAGAAALIDPPSRAPAVPVVDQSQEVLDMDFAVAASIASIGPKLGYTGALSDEGILYDANGASPVGVEAANSRFATFPADVTLVRNPERALAAGGSGSSWGSYAVKRGETVLSAGRYISVWRRETTGWKMVSELAAGKAPAASAGSTGNGVLPKRPASLGRATPTPLGVPLSVPTTPTPTSTSQTTPPSP